MKYYKKIFSEIELNILRQIMEMHLDNDPEDIEAQEIYDEILTFENQIK